MVSYSSLVPFPQEYSKLYYLLTDPANLLKLKIHQAESN